jgi:ferredoxin
MSRISVFRIKIRTDLCTQCGKCSLVCKANCINIKDQEVDLSRCVGCFNCISSCPEGGIKYTLSDRLKSQTGDYPPDPSRRKILVSAGLLLLGLAGVRKSIKASAIIENAILKSRFNDDHNAKPDSSRNDLSGSNHGVRHGQGGRSGFKHRYRRDSVPGNKQGHIWKDTFNSDPEKISVFPEKIPHNKFPTRIKPEKHYTVTPPGSLGIEHFTGTCTACHLCISACPTRVLQPSILEYGISGIMQPYMDYETNYCNFDCIICSEVCPTGAILSLTEEAKKTLQIGKVNLILENCVVRTDHTACGSCSEHCPTQAVHMVPYIGELTIPEIRPEICVGCGACEHACPTRPFRAIYVDGHYIHETALLPEEEELEEGALEEEFPF